MEKATLLLGLDLGTSGVKAGIFDTNGRRLASKEAYYKTTSPRPGWMEQNPEEWWTACAGAIKDVAGRVDSIQIRAISVSGQSPCLVCIDDSGSPVRAASLWSDQRAAAEGAEVAQRLGSIASFSLLPRLLWLKRNEPVEYHRTRWVLESFEYINFKLTGQVASIATSGLTPSLTARHIGAIALEPEKFPAQSSRLGDVLGSVAPEVASRLGLPAGLPVIAGTIDAFAAWIGTATTSKGQLCNTAGTSEGIAVVWDQALTDPQMRAVSIPHITGQDWIVGGAMSSGGIMLDWFVREFYDHTDQPYAAAVNDASVVPAGAGGLLALPYLVGERSPILDPEARSLFFGISERHSRAHFARAVLESIAFALRDVCEVIREMGAEVTEVRVAGGGARNDILNQIKADVLDLPVFVPEIHESGQLGTAIIAGWGIGCFASLSEAAQSMVKFRSVFEPRAEKHSSYTELFTLYRRLYEHLKRDFAVLARLSKTLPTH